MTILRPREFYCRPEWPRVRAWLQRFPGYSQACFKVSGCLFNRRPRVLGAIVWPLADGEMVLVGLGEGRPPKAPSRWPVVVLVVGETLFPLQRAYPVFPGLMTYDFVMVAGCLSELGELGARVACSQVTQAELEAELVLRALGALAS